MSTTNINTRLAACLVLTAACFIGGSGAAYAQKILPPCPEGFINELSWSNCIGTQFVNFGDKYIGQFKNGERTGQGTYTGADGSKYVGQFKNGKYHGQGTYTFADGRKYVGQWSDDNKNGLGELNLDYGRKYIGQFRNGKFHGQGTYVFADGSKYIGEAKNGDQHGLGVEYAPDGSAKKVGLWEKGKFIREASVPGFVPSPPKQAVVQVQPAQQIEPVLPPKPSLAEAQPAPQVQPAPQQKSLPPCPSTPSETWTDCTGTMTYPNGRTYVGDWKDGKRHGQGGSTVPSGEKYVGEFRNDEKNGQGTYTFVNGQTYVGEWKNDQRNGQGTATFLEGQIYVGEWKDGKRHGLGTITFKEGAKYVGEWRDDERNGLGVEYVLGFPGKTGVWQNNAFVREAPVPWLEQPKQASVQPAPEPKAQPQVAPVLQQAQSQPQPAALPDQGRRVALIIGNTQYEKAPLPNAVNDAELMGETLHKLGFQSVIVKKDLTQPQILQALREFAVQADSADWALFHYSGHGIEFGGVNYIVPVEAHLRTDRDIDLEAVDVSKVLTALEGAKRLRLVILDACRDNPLAGQMKRTLASRSLGRGLARVEPETGTLIAYAAKHGETALDGTGKNSPFVEALVKRLQQKPPLEVRRLFDVVRDDVMRTTNKKQQPFSYGSVSGEQDFYFAAN